jgi:hypothetical protein
MEMLVQALGRELSDKRKRDAGAETLRRQAAASMEGMEDKGRKLKSESDAEGNFIWERGGGETVSSEVG